MDNVNVIRAWKDAAYFASLSDADKASVPTNPAGNIELGADMGAIAGGRMSASSERLAASCTGSSCCTITQF